MLHRFLVLDSSMSTGKTTVLLGKARELALRGEPVLVVIFNIYTDVKSLLHLELEARFREEGINIEVTMRQKAVTSPYLDTVHVCTYTYRAFIFF